MAMRRRKPAGVSRRRGTVTSKETSHSLAPERVNVLPELLDDGLSRLLRTMIIWKLTVSRDRHDDDRSECGGGIADQSWLVYGKPLKNSGYGVEGSGAPLEKHEPPDHGRQAQREDQGMKIKVAKIIMPRSSRSTRMRSARAKRLHRYDDEGERENASAARRRKAVAR